MCLALPIDAQQQQTPRGVAATPVVPSTGRPSTIQIRQNILNQKRRALNSQVQVAQRCIANASRPEVLRDPEGNVNIVPSTDIVNCTANSGSVAQTVRRPDQGNPAVGPGCAGGGSNSPETTAAVTGPKEYHPAAAAATPGQGESVVMPMRLQALIPHHSSWYCFGQASYAREEVVTPFVRPILGRR